MLTTYAATAMSDHRAELGESPLWDGRTLRWIDITGKKLFSCVSDGRITTTDLSTTVTAIALGPGERLLAVTRRGIGWLDAASGNVQESLQVLSDDTMTMNDGAVDVWGRYWVGSATLDGTDRGALYRLADGKLDVVATNIMMSNGIDWSPDDRTLYHADSDAGTITAWSFAAEDGTLGHPRLLRRVPRDVGLPDGLTVDSSGRIWVAIWGAGEVWGLDFRTGRRMAVVSVPTPLVSSCTFGTPALGTLYITTAERPEDPGSGLLYVADVNTTGLGSHRFRDRL